MIINYFDAFAGRTGVTLPINSSNWMANHGYTSLTKANNDIDDADWSNVIDASSFYANCKSLTEALS